ncbi:MAG: glycosyl transferase family 2 [Nitrospira sp.]
MDQSEPIEPSVTHHSLPESVRELLNREDSADIVVGVLTFNDETTAPALAKTLIDGCRRYVPGQRVLLVNCDAGSQDATTDLMGQSVGQEVPFWPVRHPILGSSLHVISESGVPGRDAAIRLLATVADRVAAKACLIIDGNLKSVDPRWAELLTSPILEKGADCVLPQFSRNRYEGTLTNTLLAPLTRALYGKRVAYHQGGAYAFSKRFVAASLLDQPWDDEVALYGVDGWVTTLAVAEPAEVCEARLGPRLQQGKAKADLSTILAQSVGCMFHMMERYQSVWEPVKGSTAIPMVGVQVGLGNALGAVYVDRMIHGFRQGLRDLVPIWQIALAPDTFQRVLELGIDDADSFQFPTDLWVQIVYDLALAYHDRLLHREHLLKSLTPLYLGYTASMVLATRALPVNRVEEELERVAVEYETMKPYLIQRWRWSDE